MNVQYNYTVERRIMDDVSNGVNLKQAAKARLDNIGHVKAHCEFVNDHKRMYKMKQRGEIAFSVGLVREQQINDTEDKAAKLRVGLRHIFIPAINMFKKDEKTSIYKAH